MANTTPRELHRARIVHTGFVRDDPDNLAQAAAGTPLGRIGEPEDLADTALFFSRRTPIATHDRARIRVIDGGARVMLGGH